MFSNRAMLLALILAPAAVQGQMSIRTVALSGDQCPGAPAGVPFGNLALNAMEWYQPGPAINSSGQVAFLGAGCSTFTIWSEGHGAMERVAHQYQSVPGFGVLEYVGSGPRIKDNGDVVFMSAARELNYPVGLLSNSGGTLHTVIKAGPNGVPPAGIPSGTYFDSFSYGSLNVQTPNMSRSGRLSLNVLLSDGRVGIWGGDENNLAPYSLGGLQIPGRPPGETWGEPGPRDRPQSINNIGKIAFSESRGLWLGSLESASLKVAYPFAVPPQTPGYIFDLGHSTTNDQGDLAIYDYLNPTSGTILARSNQTGVVRSVAVTHVAQQAPGNAPSVHFSRLGFEPAINGRGQVAFRGEVAGPGITLANRDGFWAEDLQGFLKLLVQTGMQVPGFDPGTYFEYLFSGSVSFNAMGYAVFSADIRENGVSKVGYWAANPDTGSLFPIILSGQTIEVHPGDTRIVSSMRIGNDVGQSQFFSSGGQDGLPTALNDNNQAAFRVSFTDGSSGIFVVTIPEPTTLVLVAVASLAFVGSRARKRR